MSRALRRSTFVIFAALAGCGAPEVDVATRADGIGPAHCPGPVTLEGIDVSSWQGTIDWMRVAGSGKVFAIARAGHGLDEDLDFSFNWDGIKNAGLIRGVYHYFIPSLDPLQQADLLCDAVGSLGPGDLPPVIDVESTGGGMSGSAIRAAIHTWVDRVTQRLGRAPMIYTGGYFWDDNVGGSDFADLPLWLPNYSRECPLLPSPWSRWTIHQYSSTGSVDGIEGNVDLDKFDGTLEELHALAGVVACTAHCEGDVVVGADCAQTDCGAQGASCTEDALGPRCVAAACPATGTTAVCTGPKELTRCTDGAVTAVDTCPTGQVCQTEGSGDDRCVKAGQPVWSEPGVTTGAEVVGTTVPRGTDVMNADGTGGKSGGCTCAAPQTSSPGALAGALLLAGLALLARRRAR